MSCFEDGVTLLSFLLHAEKSIQKTNAIKSAMTILFVVVVVFIEAPHNIISTIIVILGEEKSNMN